MELKICPLNREHQRKNFHCGEPTLDHYIRQYAIQDVKRRVSRVFVAAPVDLPDHICGYYTLSAGGLETASLPASQKRRLPGYPIPVAMLGRLAINRDHQGQGLGSTLVADALNRVRQAAEVMAVYALVVDALHDRAGDFYRQFGFIPLPEQPLKLFLPLDTVANYPV